MVCKALDKKRRNMTISVTILGLALATVMLAYLAFGESSDISDASTIRFAAIIHRHGARTVGRSYPNDPHINYTWPGGFGFLTKQGSLQMYNLGKNMRARYYRLLPSDGLYTPNNINVLSSAAERCIMSSQSLLAGFLPPLESENMLPIQWQPIAITTVPRSLDYLIAQKKSCPKYDRLLKQMYSANTTNELKAINEKYAETYAYLTKHVGKNTSDLESAEFLYMTLLIEKEHGLELPAWTDTVFPEPLLTLAARNLAVLTETPYMKRIKGGPIVTEILDYMIKKVSNKLVPNRSIFLYSGHDVTLVNVMRALNIIEQTAIKPQYGATLALELHHNAYFNDIEVKIVYFADSDEKVPKEVKISNCDAPCKLDQFEKSMEHIIVRDYVADCKLDE